MTEEEINENLLKLEKDMAKEESVRDAILKIIAVTDSKKRSDLQKQLNACQKNIQNLKSEIDSLTGSVSNCHFLYVLFNWMIIKGKKVESVKAGQSHIKRRRRGDILKQLRL
jgi:hypothetical protein